MAHDLEMVNGEASAAFVVTGEGDRQVPWHTLGTFVTEAMTPDEALRLARLDWDARLEPVHLSSGLEVPGRKAVVRDHPETGEPEVLGVVGDGWRPVQNRLSVEFMYEVMGLDKREGYIETAGMLRNSWQQGYEGQGLGAQTFVTLRHPDLVLDPSGRADTLRPYLLMTNGFDGRRAFTLKRTAVRVVCANTQHMALEGSGEEWKVNHSKNVKQRVQEARLALDLVSRFDEQMVREAEAMLRTEIRESQFTRYVERLFPEPKIDAPLAVHERWERRMGDLHSTYRRAETQENVTGTAWGAYQAVTEYVEWLRPERKRGEAGAVATLTSPAVGQVKARAWVGARKMASALLN